MTANEILNSNKTKTAKMRLLFELGFTRRQVSEMLGVGYGFAQNVYAAQYPDRIRQRTIIEILEEAGFNFTFNRKFGIEIEAYGVDRDELTTALKNADIRVESESYNHTTRRHWKVVSDSSLHGNNTFELVSPPLKGTRGLEQLKKVTEVLQNLNAKINKSCGLHLHLEMKDYELDNWKRLLKNYTTLESQIDSVMPASRRNSNWCKSLKKTNWKTKIESASNLREISSNVYSGDRYHKVNLQSFWRQQTVEFRQHSGTVEFEKISNWINFCARLVEFSKENEIERGTFENLKRFLDEGTFEFYKERKAKFESAA